MGDNVWRAVFLSTAIFNWIVGLSLLFDTTEFAASAGVEVFRYDALYSPLVGWFVILFGLLYLAVWRDLENREIAFVGMLGKVGVVALVWLACVRGLAPTSMAGLAAVDLVFALLFAAFLIRRRAALSKS